MIILLNFDKSVADEHRFDVIKDSVEVVEDKVEIAAAASSVAVVEDRIAFD